MRLAPWCLVLAISSNSAASFAETFTFGIIADGGKWNSNAEMTRDSIVSDGVTQLILPGDNLYSSTYQKVWSNWSSLGLEFPVVAIGNHHASYREETEFFKMPAEYYAKSFGADIRFVVLNSDNETSVSAQAKFLDTELTTAKERFVFLVYHHPTFTLSHLHTWEEKRDFQNAIRPLLTKHRSKITALLLGHDHLAILAHFGDLPVIISGAVHEPRRDFPVNNVQLGVNIRTDWFYDNQPYWAKLEIDESSPKAKVSFMRSNDNQIRCTATIQTGSPAELANCR